VRIEGYKPIKEVKEAPAGKPVTADHPRGKVKQNPVACGRVAVGVYHGARIFRWAGAGI